MGQLKAAPYPNFYTNLIWLSWVMSLCALAPPVKKPSAKKWAAFFIFTVLLIKTCIFKGRAEIFERKGENTSLLSHDE